MNQLLTAAKDDAFNAGLQPVAEEGIGKKTNNKARNKVAPRKVCSMITLI